MNNQIAFLYLVLSFCYTSTIHANPSKEISIPPKATEAYLSCYALNPTLKAECVNKINIKYIPKHKQQDSDFTKEFQFEAEKQGFKEFLNNLNLPCDRVNDGPLFIEQEKAYLVKCKPDYQYLMRFDYKSNMWVIVEKE